MFVLALCALGAFNPVVGAARQQPQQRLDWSADDARRIGRLRESGRRTEGTFATLWTPAGVLDDAENAKLIDRLDKGVASLRKLIGTHPWQVVREERIVFYVSDEPFISHSTGTEAVLIPLARLRDGRAPFFHEAAHALLSRTDHQDEDQLDPATLVRLIATRPMWLSEGIAEYFGKTAARLAGVVDGDPFNSGGIEGMDRTCAQRSASPEGATVLPFIGTLDAPGELFTTERPKFAPIFYPCAFSFTKHVATLIGDRELIGLMALQSRVDLTTTPAGFTPDGVLPRIEKLTGRTREQVRAEWLRTLPKLKDQADEQVRLPQR